MPFRRKNRNSGSLFGSSRSADKENSNDAPEAPIQVPSLSLLRCRSDTTQRTCSNINPNTILKRSSSQSKHRNGELISSTKESNLQLLNSTLVKEVSNLRAFNRTMAQEKKELENEVLLLEAAKTETVEKLDATEDRIQCLRLVVDNLENMNDVLAEEAARLRENTDRFKAEKQALLADFEKMSGEKSLLEELLQSIRASGDAFHEDMQQALLQAEMEKNALAAEKETLVQEMAELQLDKEKMTKDITKLFSERGSLLVEKEDLIMEKDKLEREVSIMYGKNEELVKQLASKKQALACAQENLVNEKVRMLTEKTELEVSIRCMREDHEEALSKLEEEKQALQSVEESIKMEVDQLQSMIRQLSEERDVYKTVVGTLRHELMLSKEALIDSQTVYKVRLNAAMKENNDPVSQLQRELDKASPSVRDGSKGLTSTNLESLSKNIKLTSMDGRRTMKISNSRRRKSTKSKAKVYQPKH